MLSGPSSRSDYLHHPATPLTSPLLTPLRHCPHLLRRHPRHLPTPPATPVVRCSAETAARPPSETPLSLKTKNILVLGGSGRVGSSTASALLSQGIGSKVIVAGRTVDSYRAAIDRRAELKDTDFRVCDIDDPTSLLKALEGVDVVLHTAGPFQRKEQCAVLEAAIASGTPYIDVCDDMDYAQRAKSYCERAREAGVPAITTAGIYPGVSNVMAAHMIAIARKEYDEEWKYIPRVSGEGTDPRRVLYAYFTAGTGGAGPTILETSLLLAGEDVTAFKDGQQLSLPPISNRRVVDFGRGIGRRSVYLYNLPEVLSGAQVFKVPNISARFGTDPEFWNWAMVLTAKLFPKSFLSNRQQVREFVGLLDPLVRPIDAVVGEKMAMLVEVDLQNGENRSGLYVHRKLSECVGVATAAFVAAMLGGETQPGVWFPEEHNAISDRRGLLQRAAIGTYRFELNQPAWQFDTDAVRIGMGFYW